MWYSKCVFERARQSQTQLFHGTTIMAIKAALLLLCAAVSTQGVTMGHCPEASEDCFILRGGHRAVQSSLASGMPGRSRLLLAQWVEEDDSSSRRRSRTRHMSRRHRERNCRPAANAQRRTRAPPGLSAAVAQHRQCLQQLARGEVETCDGDELDQLLARSGDDPVTAAEVDDGLFAENGSAPVDDDDDDDDDAADGGGPLARQGEPDVEARQTVTARSRASASAGAGRGSARASASASGGRASARASARTSSGASADAAADAGEAPDADADVAEPAPEPPSNVEPEPESPGSPESPDDDDPEGTPSDDYAAGSALNSPTATPGEPDVDDSEVVPPAPAEQSVESTGDDADADTAPPPPAPVTDPAPEVVAEPPPQLVQSVEPDSEPEETVPPTPVDDSAPAPPAAMVPDPVAEAARAPPEVLPAADSEPEEPVPPANPPPANPPPANPPPTSPPPPSNAGSPPPDQSDRYVVCVAGDSSSFGQVGGRKPNGIRVSADGTCTLSEWAGGFDGYWSVDAGDGHEDGLALAVKLMLRDSSAQVGARAGQNNPRNARVNAFMKEMRDRAKPVDLDYPQDEERADNGLRAENIRGASRICTRMITVQSC
eukprot:jgi/Ulvmu1/3323/UM155_0006.1